jgi:hypothetical protein
MIQCLIRVLSFGQSLYPNQATQWIFPADNKSGHLAEHKENRDELSKWGNDLRQTFRTIAQTAGVPELDVHLLMNSIPGVNTGLVDRPFQAAPEFSSLRSPRQRSHLPNLRKLGLRFSRNAMPPSLDSSVS